MTKIAVKSTPGLAPVEVLHLGVASLAGLQPDVRRDREKVTNDSFTLPNKFYLTKTAVKSTPGLAPVEVLHFGGWLA